MKKTISIPIIILLSFFSIFLLLQNLNLKKQIILFNNKTVPAFTCGTANVNDLDGNTYHTVQIGSQCWMKENLKVSKNPQNKTINRYCYNNDPNICNTDGGLYDWDTGMNGSTSCDGTGAVQPNCLLVVQGICPTGWHIPSHYEWILLLKNIGSNPDLFPYDTTTIDEIGINEGTNLKQGGLSGFEGILAGFRDRAELFFDRGAKADFWSSTEGKINITTKDGLNTVNGPWGLRLDSHTSKIFLSPGYYKETGTSVRCLKD